MYKNPAVFDLNFIFRLRDEKSAVKTLWPVACREFLFLPEYKVQHGDIEKKFEIITFVAKGAFGSVYKVRQIKDSQVFALKVLEKSKVEVSRIYLQPCITNSPYHTQIILEDYVQQLKYEVLIQQAVSHHPFITTSHKHWQNKAFVYQRKFPVFLHHFTSPDLDFPSFSL